MRFLDWLVLVASLVFIVLYGLWKGRGSRDMHGYLLAGRQLPWYNIAFAIMATQASAITFLSTPGQAYADGMRFVQFYLGLPLAMIILAMVAVPIYHRLKVYTAYEYLEHRFDLKTRSLAAGLFLIQRGLAAGLTIYAPAIILSVILGWDTGITVLVIGSLVTLYTASGGTRAVNWTQFHQMIIIMTGMVAAFIAVILLLPRDISFLDAAHVAGKMARLNAIDFTFDIKNRYTFWSGLIGGMFVALSYFGTDQSQVQRYLTGRSIAQSRMGLLFNGLVKVPMQFFILFLGAMVFVFYQFVPPPVFFNRVEVMRVRQSEHGPAFQALEMRYRAAHREKERRIRELLDAIKSGDPERIARTEQAVHQADARAQAIRQQAIDLIRLTNPDADPNDVNYVFLAFVIHYLPAGLVGLIIAVVFAASMSSTSSELNALASTTVVDIYRRRFRTRASERHYVWVSKAATVFWGVYAILFAEYASRLGSLVEAVNILGSLFYGTILGIFMVAFFLPRVTGTPTFIAALIAEVAVLYCFWFTQISWLWYNVVGCLLVILLAVLLNPFLGRAHGSHGPMRVFKT